MAMMQIRQVRMTVSHRLMLVQVAMRLRAAIS
jgi:hypothetical protein